MTAVKREVPFLAPYQFRPGQSGNPGGRPKMPPSVKAIFGYKKHEVAKIISKYGRMPQYKLDEALRDKEMPVLDRSICELYLRAIEDRDYICLNFLLDRSIGKSAAPLLDDPEDPVDAVKSMPLHDLLLLVKANLPSLEKVLETQEPA